MERSVEAGDSYSETGRNIDQTVVVVNADAAAESSVHVPRKVSWFLLVPVVQSKVLRTMVLLLEVIGKVDYHRSIVYIDQKYGWDSSSSIYVMSFSSLCFVEQSK